MARKGHPRVPRAIRGERRRLERLARERQGRVLPRLQRAIAARRPPTVTKQGAVLHVHGDAVHSDALRDAYTPLVRAALGNEQTWQQFSQQYPDGLAEWERELLAGRP
jgi:hypothetical protein